MNICALIHLVTSPHFASFPPQIDTLDSRGLQQQLHPNDSQTPNTMEHQANSTVEGRVQQQRQTSGGNHHQSPVEVVEETR